MISRYFAAALLALGLSGVPQAQAADGTSAAPPQVFMTSPTSKPDGTRWRLGYVESGEYSEYPRTLGAIVGGLQRLGWLGLSEDIPTGMTGRELWSWLSRNARSSQLEFVEDAWWQPGDFDADKRAPMREAIMHRLDQKKDIDLIIAMGTWAGQDMRALGPPIPTIVGSASDPIAAKISDSAADSGRDNLHARIEPDRYQRQVRLFHEIVPFKKLGIVYEDSDAGRSYAAVAAVEQVAEELGFSVEHCHAQSNSIATEAATENALNCYRQLSSKVDAAYVTLHRGITSTSIKDLAHLLEKAKIPSFSMAGSQEVEQGILLSLAQADVSYVGLFHAETIARIFNGAKPRQLSQLWVDPPKIALNLGTARIIGFDPPVDILLAADEVYEKAP
ncbi:ABC transporter substrate-binding protein [Parapusillimonas sp. JC17]|uniref:ABC transporter substrate-binding protein n=1 Tax=Parapusillimonas sp. JC17 TaxID=3445768 RepID=UPI003FA05B85